MGQHLHHGLRQREIVYQKLVDLDIWTKELVDLDTRTEGPIPREIAGTVKSRP